MNRPIVIVAILCTSVATATRAEAQKSAEQLAGSWKLVSYEDRDATGAVVYPYGKC